MYNNNNNNTINYISGVWDDSVYTALTSILGVEKLFLIDYRLKKTKRDNRSVEATEVTATEARKRLLAMPVTTHVNYGRCTFTDNLFNQLIFYKLPIIGS